MASRIFSGLDGGKITSLFVSLLMLSSFGLTVYADTLLYDDNGNLVEGEGKCFVYDGANRLRSVTDCGSNVLAEYSYDHVGRRVLKVEHAPQGDVSTYYFSGDYEEVYYPNGTVKKVTYYRANGELVGRREVVDGFERMYFVHGDHLGSTSVVTDSSGNKVEEVHYYPFGSMRTELSDTDSRYLFTGQELDTETGLYYYKSRYYNPGTGRFAQPDTLIPDVYNPQSLNRYSYVENNPVKYTDPSGHYIDTAIDAASIAISLNDLRNDPSNPWNYAALGADIVCAGLPVIAGGGRVVKAVGNGDVVKYSDEALEAAGRGLKSVENTVEYGRLSLASPAVRKFSGKLERMELVGRVRVSQVVSNYGDEVLDVSKSITTSRGPGDIDVLVKSNDELLAIEVGGPAKARDLAGFGQQLAKLKEWSMENNAKAMFYYAVDTPADVIKFASERLGAENVIKISS